MCSSQEPHAPDPAADRLVEAAVIARALGVSEETVHRLAVSGVIPSVVFPLPDRIRPIRRFVLAEVIAAGRKHANLWQSIRPRRLEGLAGKTRKKRRRKRKKIR